MDLVDEIEKTIDRLRQGKAISNWQSLIDVCNLSASSPETKKINGLIVTKYVHKLEKYNLVKLVSKWKIPVNFYRLDTKDNYYGAFVLSGNIMMGQIEDKSTNKEVTYWFNPTSK